MEMVAASQRQRLGPRQVCEASVQRLHVQRVFTLGVVGPEHEDGAEAN